MQITQGNKRILEKVVLHRLIQKVTGQSADKHKKLHPARVWLE